MTRGSRPSGRQRPSTASLRASWTRGAARSRAGYACRLGRPAPRRHLEGLRSLACDRRSHSRPHCLSPSTFGLVLVSVLSGLMGLEGMEGESRVRRRGKRERASLIEEGEDGFAAKEDSIDGGGDGGAVGGRNQSGSSRAAEGMLQKGRASP